MNKQVKQNKISILLPLKQNWIQMFFALFKTIFLLLWEEHLTWDLENKFLYDWISAKFKVGCSLIFCTYLGVLFFAWCLDELRQRHTWFIHWDINDSLNFIVSSFSQNYKLCCYNKDFYLVCDLMIAMPNQTTFLKSFVFLF